MIVITLVVPALIALALVKVISEMIVDRYMYMYFGELSILTLCMAYYLNAILNNLSKYSVFRGINGFTRHEVYISIVG